MEVRDVSKAKEFLTALRAVKDRALSEGRVSEYDVYVTSSAGVVCNDLTNPVLREAGPYFLREIYPTKAEQDAHGKDSEALTAFRAVKGALADFKNPDRAVDIPRATVTEGKVVSEEEFLALLGCSATGADTACAKAKKVKEKPLEIQSLSKLDKALLKDTGSDVASLHKKVIPYQLWPGFCSHLPRQQLVISNQQNGI